MRPDEVTVPGFEGKFSLSHKALWKLEEQSGQNIGDILTDIAKGSLSYRTLAHIVSAFSGISLEAAGAQITRLGMTEFAPVCKLLSLAVNPKIFEDEKKKEEGQPEQ